MRSGSQSLRMSKSARLAWRLRRSVTGYVFVAPAVLLLAVFVAYPIFRSLQLSLYKWDGLTAPEFIGLANFARLQADPLFEKTILNTLFFTVFAAGGTVLIGLGLAFAIFMRVRGWRIFKFAWFIPVIISMTVTGLLWDGLLATTDSPINGLIRMFGVEPPVWLANPQTALPVIVAVTIWQFSGFPMLLFLAAMEVIPRDLEEAAHIEGAGPLQLMRHIILPLIRPVVAVVVLLQLIFSFKVFDIVWVMTKGGPGDASLVLGVFVYRAGFQFQRFGYASAIAVVVGLIILVLTLLYLRFVRPQSYEY